MTIGVPFEDQDKILIIGEDLAFTAPLSVREIKNPRRDLHLRRDTIWFPLQRKHVCALAKLSLELNNKPEIVKEESNKAFQNLLRKHTYYLYHSNEVEHYIVCCWILGTYLYVMFQVFSILAAGGVRESGKGTTLSFISMCAHKAPPRAVVPSLADISREIHNMRSTITMDEADYVGGESYAELRAFLESVTERGVTRPIMNKDTGKPDRLETQAPLAYASRGKIDVEDKAILMVMEEPDDLIYYLRRSELEEDPEWEEIIQQCMAFALTYHRAIRKAYDDHRPSPRLYGRDFQLWRPILAISKIACPEKFDAIKEYAENYALNRRKRAETAEIEVVLLREVAENIDVKAEYYLTELTEIVQRQLQWIKGWQPVAAAVRNLKCLKTTRPPSRGKGVRYVFDIEKVKTRARKRGIDLGGDKQSPFEKHACASCLEILRDQGLVESWEELEGEGICEWCGGVTSFFRVRYRVPETSSGSTAELIKALRERWAGGSRESFIGLAMKVSNFKEGQAKRLFDDLVLGGYLAEEREGQWKWGR